MALREPDARTLRRHNPVINERNRALNQIHALELTIQQRNQEWNQEVSGIALSSAVFNASPFIVRFVHDYRLFHDQLEHLQQTVIMPQAEIDRLKKLDIIGRRIHGVSIADIAHLPLDPKALKLSSDGYQKVNAIHLMTEPLNKLRHRKNPQMKEDESMVLYTIAYYATQPWAQRKRFRGDPTNEHLQQVLTAYFDEFVERFTANNLPRSEATALFQDLSCGQPWLPTPVATYIVARLGITPSSATKLFDRRHQQAPSRLQKWVWNRISKNMSSSVTSAYMEGNLPDAILPYQQYNSTVENLASKLLTRYYQNTTDSTADTLSIAKQETRLDKPKFDTLLSQIEKSDDQYLDFPLSQDQHALKSVQVASQNRDVIIFVLHLANGSHLTLELARTGKLFGISHNLEKAIPQIDSFLFRDVIEPIIQKTVEAKKADAIPHPSTQPQTNRLDTLFNVFRNRLTEAEQVANPRKRKRQTSVLPSNGNIYTAENVAEKLTPYPPKNLHYNLKHIEDDLKHNGVKLTKAEKKHILAELKRCAQGELKMELMVTPHDLHKFKVELRRNTVDLRIIFDNEQGRDYFYLTSFPREHDSYNSQKVNRLAVMQRKRREEHKAAVKK